MSEKPKHTPGPWRVRTIDGSIGHVETLDGVAVANAEIVGTLRQPNTAERKANARIISAAPEMLEALIAQERADWARRNYESISCDPLHPDREALNLEMIQTMSHAAALRKEAIAKAKP
jgi:hypothetical protein